jgi:predicted ATPase
MLFEDVRWIDPTTLEVLGHVIAAVAELPVLVIVTFRPEVRTALGRRRTSRCTLNRQAATMRGDG